MRRVGLYLALATLCLGRAAGASSKRAETPQTHQVYPGQTLGMIAKRYNVSVEALCSANGVTRNKPIKPKQVLVIPDGNLHEANDASEDQHTDAEATPAQANSESAKGKSGKSRAAAPGGAKLERTGKEMRATLRMADPYARVPAKRGYINVSSTTGSFHGYAVTREGKVTDAARKAFVRVMASWRTGQQEAVHDRLIRVLAKVSDHFGSRPMRIVSGFRPYSPLQYTPHSRHNLGHASDFFIPGVPNTALRDFCLGLGKVGVGYYPNSTFVHLDVREVHTTWVDYSGPGEAPRYTNSRPRTPKTDELGTFRPASATAPVGDYPELRAVDPASLETDAFRSRPSTTDSHIGRGSRATRTYSRQVRGTL